MRDTVPLSRRKEVMVPVLTFLGALILLIVINTYAVQVLQALAQSRPDITLVGFLNSGFSLMIQTSIAALVAYIAHQRLHTKTEAKKMASEMTSELVLSRERFRVLYDNSPLPYFLMGPEGEISGPNKAALRFFGGDVEEVTALNLYDQLVFETPTASPLAVLKSKIDRGVPVHRMEVQVENRSGNMRWVLLSIFSSGESVELETKRLVTMVDITDEKELERAKTEFVSLASHQLRTPLTTVKWNIDLLLNSETFTVPDEAREFLNKIYIGNERMIELVGTLLNVSRIEMGTVPIYIKETNMRDLVQDVYDELEPLALEKQVALTTDYADTSTLLHTDSSMVRIIVQNLIANALRYTSKDGRVTVRTRVTPTECVVEVEDTGCGIPPEAYSKIFTKMYRAENARKVEAKGTGLGLYLSKSFAELLGGDITFTSKLNEGSTFTLTIPTHARPQ